jgi:hypothetical protein
MICPVSSCSLAQTNLYRSTCGTLGQYSSWGSNCCRQYSWALQHSKAVVVLALSLSQQQQQQGMVLQLPKKTTRIRPTLIVPQMQS